MEAKQSGIVPGRRLARRTHGATALMILLLAPSLTATAWARKKPDGPLYGRPSTFGVFAAYSNDSSPMILGTAGRRKLFDVGASYSRTILRNRVVNWQYDGELLPVALESDPVQYTVTTTTLTDPVGPPIIQTQRTGSPTLGACHPSSGSGEIPGFYSYTYTSTCGRRWTIGEALSPIGFQWNFLTRHRLQPLLEGHGGEMYSTQAIPVDNAGNFNFTFDFGAGLQWFQSQRHSIRFEYRYHHISNHNTAEENPGIDSGLAQVSYCFSW